MRITKAPSEYSLVLTGGSVWAQIIDSQRTVRSVFVANDLVSAGLKNFTLSLVDTATEKIGWDFGLNEDYLTGQLRASLIAEAGAAGHKG